MDHSGVIVRGGLGAQTHCHRSATHWLTSLCLSRFNMRPDIQSYHLGGMGCGTGVVGINLIRDLLKV